MKKFLIIAIIGLLLPLAAFAGGRRMHSNVQNIIFFSSKGPVLLRVNVKIDGTSAPVAFLRYCQKWVNFLDRDGDNMLNATEVKTLPDGQGMQRLAQSGYYYFVANRSNLSMTTFGKNADDKVDADDVAAYYRRSGISPYRFSPTYSRNAGQAQASEALFKNLDADADGKLSKSELTEGMAVLRNLDLNDDELISQTELTAGLSASPYTSGGAGRIVRQPNNRNAVPSAFYIVKSGGSITQLTALILAKYDENKDTKLSRKEMGLDPAAFSRLDINKDKNISITEMIRFMSTVTPVPIMVRLGRRQANQSPVDIAAKDIERAGVKLTRTNRGDYHLLTDDAKVSIHHVDANQAMMAVMRRNIYLQQFRLANTKKKKALTKEDLKGARYRFLMNIFPLTDKNGDGKLTEGELTEFGKLTQGAQQCFVSIGIGEEGRALFGLVDSNRDQQISTRELISAWRNLRPADPNGFGKLSVNDFARQFVIAVSRGQQRYTNIRLPNQQGNPGLTVNRPGSGPIWFQKMDVNRDGDVSVREFLGPRDVFQRIDANHDGLIDGEEAQKASK